MNWQPGWEVLLQVSRESLISVVRWQLWLEISRGSAGRPGQLGLSLCNFRAFSRGLSRRVGRFLPWKLRVPKSSKRRWKAQKWQSLHLLSVKRVTELCGPPSVQKGVTPACEHWEAWFRALRGGAPVWGIQADAAWPVREHGSLPAQEAVTLVRCCPHVAIWGQCRHRAQAFVSWSRAMSQGS